MARWYEHRAWSSQDWQDRVADKDEPLDDARGTRDDFADEAAEFASVIVECTIAPLAAMAEGFARTMHTEARDWARHRRHHAHHHHR